MATKHVVMFSKIHLKISKPVLSLFSARVSPPVSGIFGTFLVMIQEIGIVMLFYAEVCLA